MNVCENYYEAVPSNHYDAKVPTLDYQDNRGVHQLPFMVVRKEVGKGLGDMTLSFRVCYAFKEDDARAIADALNRSGQ